MSKSFDNGMICASEQAVIVDKEISKDFERLMKEAKCYIATKEEKEKLQKVIFDVLDDGKFKLDSKIPGQSPSKIASLAGIEIPEDTKVLMVKEDGVRR